MPREHEELVEFDPICIHCNEFFTIFRGEPSEYGICLLDDVFEPYMEEILVEDYSSCQDLINEQEFNGNRDVCEQYNPTEWVMDLDLDRMGVERVEDLTVEDIEQYLLRKELQEENAPVEASRERLKNPDPEEQKKGIQTLAGLHGFGNKSALGVLIAHLKELPVVETIDDVHDRIEILEHLRRSPDPELVQFLKEELYRTPSNNTTRQWLSAIFDFFQGCSLPQAEEALKKVATDNKNFSHRLRKKAREKLERRESIWGV